MWVEGGGEHARELSSVIDGVIPVFQPVLWLDDMSIAGYEALARGPGGTPFEQPEALFAAARGAGLTTELDGAMTRHSIEATEAVDWHPSLTIFGNLDPDAMRGPPDEATLQALGRAAASGTRIVVEITERSLLAQPSALVRAIAMVRRQGFGIAMDDVGAEEDSLTLLPILQPDVVKLDMSILHRPFDSHAARVSGMARVYCDYTGSKLVCEGVETAVHEARARALGADLVQGYRYGAPGPLPVTTVPTSRSVPLLDRDPDDARSLADQLASVPESWLPGLQILSVARELIDAVAGQTSSAVVVATAPSSAHLPEGFLDALAAAVPHSALVALIAPGCEPEPAPRLRGVDASVEQVIGSPWSISVIGPTMAVSILSSGLRADPDAPVRHRIVHDRATVAHVLRLLLAHVAD